MKIHRSLETETLRRALRNTRIVRRIVTRTLRRSQYTPVVAITLLDFFIDDFYELDFF